MNAIKLLSNHRLVPFSGWLNNLNQTLNFVVFCSFINAQKHIFKKVKSIKNLIAFFVPFYFCLFWSVLIIKHLQRIFRLPHEQRRAYGIIKIRYCWKTIILELLTMIRLTPIGYIVLYSFGFILYHICISTHGQEGSR